MHLLGQQVRKALVAREAEVDQHYMAIGMHDYVLGLHVVVDDTLPVDAVQRVGARGAQARHFVERERRALCDGGEVFALHEFHRDVGRSGERARGDVARNMRPRERGQDHDLGLESHHADRAFAASHAGHLHGDRETRPRAVERCGGEDAPHGSHMDALAEDEIADAAAGLQLQHH